MARISSSNRWLPGIETILDTHHQKVFSHQQLNSFLNTQKQASRIPQSTSLKKFLSILTEERHLTEVQIRREHRRSPEAAKTRYVWRQASPYSIGLSLAKDSYLSHASAMFVHALTDQIPKTIYVNKEQSPKPSPRGDLSQPAIDRAFHNAPRTSKYAFASQNFRFVLLSGKNTDRLEVSEILDPYGDLVDCTKIERTLIDIVVRPSYAGGVFEVLRAYRSAKSRMSINVLLATLKKLNYVYPYHQSIGFLLERAGYDDKTLAKIEAMDIPWNFYLDYKLKSPLFNPRWRLYHPQMP